MKMRQRRQLVARAPVHPMVRLHWYNLRGVHRIRLFRTLWPQALAYCVRKDARSA